MSIDGLQTRAEKTRGDSSAARSSAMGSFATGSKRRGPIARTQDPFAMQRGAKGYGRDMKPVEKPVKKSVETGRTVQKRAVGVAGAKRIGQISSENEYKRKVLGFTEDELDLDLESEELKRQHRRAKLAKRRKRKSRVKKVLIGVGVTVTAAMAVLYFWGDSIISKMTGGQVGLFDLFRNAVLVDSSGVRLKEDASGRTNVLLFGTSGYDMQGTEDDGIHAGAQLTDSIMALSLDQDTGDIAMISLQRDLLVGTCTSVGKINEVYWCANQYGDDETSGANALKDSVSKVLGLDFQYYVHVNWQALVSIVDALDGITVTLDEDVQDSWTKTYISAGEPKKINGEQALGLARARHGTLRGDFTRTASQQKILLALKNRVVESGFSLTELIQVASVLGDNVRMDFSAEELAASARLATSLDLSQMRSISLTDLKTSQFYLTTDYINGVSYVVPTAGTHEYGEIKNFVKAELANEIVIKDSPKAAKILVLNGSGRAGAAAAERDELTKSGFTVSDIGDAPAGEYMERISLYSVTGLEEMTKKLEAYYNVVAISKDELPYGIDTEGVDFVVIIGVN